MSSFFVNINGQRSLSIGGRNKEGRFADPQGYEWVPLNVRVLCREGNEESIQAPKGSKCIRAHVIKAGEKAYALSERHFVCEKHLPLVPTLDLVRKKYDDMYHRNIKMVIQK
jgi:hypothetical protein